MSEKSSTPADLTGSVIRFTREFGVQSSLLVAVIIFGAWFLTSSFMQHEQQINLRLEQQSKRIEESERFIRITLVEIQRETSTIAHECAVALERNTTALDHLLAKP